MEAAFVWILSLLLAFSVTVLVQAFSVALFRRRLLRRIETAAQMEAFFKVDEVSMAVCFWRPLRSFYRGTPLEELAYFEAGW
jgi:hypothetical protein